MSPTQAERDSVRRERAREESQQRASEPRTKYRVKPGHSVTVATDEDDQFGLRRQQTYTEGQEVELTKDEFASAAHAVEKGERRSGQTNRLKRQIERLEAQIKEQNELLKRAGKKDPEIENALKSIRQRGDNYMARGEPDPIRASSDALAAFAAGGGEFAEGSMLSPDELEEGVGGMKGAGSTERQTSPATDTTPGAAGQPS